MYYNKLLSYGLPRELWVVEAGIFLNYLGWGTGMPVEGGHLHEARGFGLGVAGLVVGVVTGLAVVAAPLAGPAIDRVGARATATGAGIALAAGYTGLGFAHTPAQAFAAAVAAGMGDGGLLPRQAPLLPSLVSPYRRHPPVRASRLVATPL